MDESGTYYNSPAVRFVYDAYQRLRVAEAREVLMSMLSRGVRTGSLWLFFAFGTVIIVVVIVIVITILLPVPNLFSVFSLLLLLFNLSCLLSSAGQSQCTCTLRLLPNPDSVRVFDSSANVNDNINDFCDSVIIILSVRTEFVLFFVFIFD